MVRHTERHLATDPPAAAELEALANDIRSLMIEALSERSGAAVESGIAVAGTPTSLAAIDLSLDPYDPERVHGHRLSLETIQHQLSELASLPLAERRQVTGLHPDRAATIVAGVVILVEAMRALGLERDHGLRARHPARRRARAGSGEEPQLVGRGRPTDLSVGEMSVLWTGTGHGRIIGRPVRRRAGCPPLSRFRGFRRLPHHGASRRLDPPNTPIGP